jgi:hypothetical protein
MTVASAVLLALNDVLRHIVAESISACKAAPAAELKQADYHPPENPVRFNTTHSRFCCSPVPVLLLSGPGRNGRSRDGFRSCISGLHYLDSVNMQVKDFPYCYCLAVRLFMKGSNTR